MRIVDRQNNFEEVLEGKLTVGKALEKLNINPESVIVIKEGQLVTHDTLIKEDEEIEIMSVVSGG